MNSTISLTSLNQANGGKTCCICLEKKSVDIPIITCDHRHEFCNECIIQWLAMKKFDCPICRKVWQDKECVSLLHEEPVDVLCLFVFLVGNIQSK